MFLRLQDIPGSVQCLCDEIWIEVFLLQQDREVVMRELKKTLAHQLLHFVVLLNEPQENLAVLLQHLFQQ